MFAGLSNTSVERNVICSVICAGLLILVALGGGLAFLATNDGRMIVLTGVGILVLAGFLAYYRLGILFAMRRQSGPRTDAEPH